MRVVQSPMKATDSSPARPVFNKYSQSGMTLTEVFVVTVVLAILIGVCLPVFTSVAVKGENTNALSNAKQIALALRLYASDNNGVYPSYTLLNGKPTSTAVADSNTAFAQLFPTYVQSESIFWLAKSKFCTINAPDEVTDNPTLDVPVNTLNRGENEWAYVIGLTDKSNPEVPMIASGFYNPVSHTYTSDVNRKGGVWKGVQVIIVHADSSGSIKKVDQATMTLTGPNGSGGMTGDIFTTANSAKGWLTPANTVVNPK